MGSVFEDALPRVEPSFSLAISHCPWRPDRAANMVRMREVLGAAAGRDWFHMDGIAGTYREITDRAPNHIWSRVMWRWGAAQPASHTVYLQDDLELAPAFWMIVRAMVRAVPNRVIGLIANHPLSFRAQERGHAWFRMCETLGSGYIVPTCLMGVFLDWESRQSDTAKRECEDFVLTRWEFETGRRSWCTIPSIIQTIDDIGTTDPRVSYPFRKSYITWRDVADPKALTDAAYWTPRTAPPDFGPSVGNDTRLGRGPFANDEVLQAHYRSEKR
jgi:hypothetical protein